jgi:hypothetical protein
MTGVNRVSQLKSIKYLESGSRIQESKHLIFTSSRRIYDVNKQHAVDRMAWLMRS